MRFYFEIRFIVNFAPDCIHEKKKEKIPVDANYQMHGVLLGGKLMYT